MKKKILLIGIALLILTSFSGCDLAPKFRSPNVILPTKKEFPLAKEKETLKWGWWKSFNDPVLNKLIDKALKNNTDLLIAATKVEQLIALAGFRKAQLYPLLGYKAQVSRTKIPENIENQIEGIGKTFSSLPIPGAAAFSFNLENPKTSYNIVGSVSYELDFWGKLRNAKKAALARVLAAKAMQDTIKISLVSGIANLYFNLVGISKELEVAKRLKDVLKKIYEIQKKQWKLGLVNKILVCQAKSNYEELKGLIKNLEEKKKELEATLAYLVGETPRELFSKRELDLGKAKLPKGLKVPGMLPSQLLLNRPDIILAEEQLKAANFDVGVAKAAYFPDINLTGYTGSLSSKFSDLMKSSSIFWSIGSGIVGPIFTFGRIKSQVKLMEAKKKEALLNYIKTVRNAFKEVYTGLIKISYSKKQLRIQENKLSVLKEAYDIRKGLYENGLSNELEVLILRANYLKQRLQVIQTKVRLISNYIYLYKALGGGIYLANK